MVSIIDKTYLQLMLFITYANVRQITDMGKGILIQFWSLKGYASMPILFKVLIWFSRYNVLYLNTVRERKKSEYVLHSD